MRKVCVPVIISLKSIFFFIALQLSCCTNKKSTQKDNVEQTKISSSSPAQYKKPQASFNDTLIINSICALFYNPDSLQLNKIKGLLKKEEYETEVHNCFYLMRNARIVIKQYWPQIHIVETSRARYLLFIKADKSKTLIDLNAYTDMCGIILFDQKKAPELIDMMNIDTALGFYFKS